MSFHSTKRPTIVIADDERLNRELVRAFLESAGYTVFEASNGNEALAQARNHNPALVMLDVRMYGGMTGYEVARALKSDPATNHIKVVMLSAQNRPSDLAEARDAGADAYLYKLLDWGQILRRVGELISESQRH